ncbi:protein Z, vitamin K-dependent plasma glycoprotein b [Cyclopterus lumpus]|uniref:protein Z, vitamin K-dependent plasma glycoprotein b n=1 Tax=Cyclopterus lumpus TaxID=8103 RepID=UPI0014861B10|nr:protein Z, vitamin K-dependent plasma glycoprotein b [Cyclopterus lumpus]
MAVSNMSASLPSLYLLVCFLQVLTRGQVIRAPQHQVFLRSRRANMFLLEEILQGNLERECHEETCDYEEAREYFEDKDKAVAFWSVYVDGDQCDSAPCLHGGNCTDRVGGFNCSCTPPHHGLACELELSGCPTEGPTACHQLCSPSSRSFSCSCVPGFKLQTDGRSCLPEAAFPCGRLPDEFNATPSSGPWQVSLLSSGGQELCGGVVLGRRSVLTAARCLLMGSPSDLRPSNFVVVAGNEKTLIPVRALYVHNGFRTDQQDNDLALLELAHPLSFGPAAIHLCLPDKDFSENILMHSGRSGVTTSRGSGRTQELVYMTLDECRVQSNVSHPLSNKMFCMRSQDGPSGNQNGPLGNQSGPLRNLSQAQERLVGLTVDQNQNPAHNGTENYNKSKIQNQQSLESDRRSRSEVSARRCGGLPPGTAVATVERGTAFLTGLLMSSPSSCDGLVFSKLSRYLSWIRPRLEAAEDHMTTQVHQYPEHR